MVRNVLTAILMPLWLATTLSAAAAAYDFAQFADPGKNLPTRAFPECCKQPGWWADVEKLPIRSIEGLYEIWQNKTIPDRQKAKSFFQAIRDYQHKNDEIVATAISLYPNVDRKYPDLIPLLEYGVGRYFRYDSSKGVYGGTPGNRSAGLVRHLARQYQKDGRDADAVNLLASFMAMREGEANPHLQQLICMELARSLDRLGQSVEAYHLLGYAQTNYDGSWGEKIAEQRADMRQRLSLFERLPENTPYYLLLLVLIGTAGTFTIVRYRQA